MVRVGVGIRVDRTGFDVHVGVAGVRAFPLEGSGAGVDDRLRAGDRVGVGVGVDGPTGEERVEARPRAGDAASVERVGVERVGVRTRGCRVAGVEHVGVARIGGDSVRVGRVALFDAVERRLDGV